MSILINAALSGGLLLAALSIKLQIGLMSLCNRFLKNEKARAMVDRGNIQINALRRMLHETMQNKTVLYKVYFLEYRENSRVVYYSVCLFSQ